MESERPLHKSRCPLKPRDGPLIDACLCPLGNLIFQVIEYRPTYLPTCLPPHSRNSPALSMRGYRCCQRSASGSAVALTCSTWTSGRQAPPFPSPEQRNTHAVPPGHVLPGGSSQTGWGGGGRLMLISRDWVWSQRLNPTDEVCTQGTRWPVSKWTSLVWTIRKLVGGLVL